MGIRPAHPHVVEHQGALVRTLALGAVAVALGAVLASSQRLPEAPPVLPELAPQVLGVELPAYVVGPAVVLDPTPTDHPATGRPVRIRVPDLGVDVPVVPLGLSGGVLVPPADPQQLGWWEGGAEPGALEGTAILTGHTVSSGGGALDRLHRLEAGDKVVVVTARGRIGYHVDNVAKYSKTTLARVSERVFDQHSPGRLVLVTCTDFDGFQYLANTVAFASVEQ